MVRVLVRYSRSEKEGPGLRSFTLEYQFPSLRMMQAVNREHSYRIVLLKIHIVQLAMIPRM